MSDTRAPPRPRRRTGVARRAPNARRLLGEWICAAGIAHRVLLREVHRLPLSLRSVAELAQREGLMWLAWEGTETHPPALVTAGRLPALVARERRWALHVCGYDSQGELVRSGVWIRHTARRWRCADWKPQRPGDSEDG